MDGMELNSIAFLHARTAAFVADYMMYQYHVECMYKKKEKMKVCIWYYNLRNSGVFNLVVDIFFLIRKTWENIIYDYGECVECRITSYLTMWIIPKSNLNKKYILFANLISYIITVQTLISSSTII